MKLRLAMMSALGAVMLAASPHASAQQAGAPIVDASQFDLRYEGVVVNTPRTVLVAGGRSATALVCNTTNADGEVSGEAGQAMLLPANGCALLFNVTQLALRPKGNTIIANVYVRIFDRSN